MSRPLVGVMQLPRQSTGITGCTSTKEVNAVILHIFNYRRPQLRHGATERLMA